MNTINNETLNKWRLILGKNSEDNISFSGGENDVALFLSMEDQMHPGAYTVHAAVL